MLRMLLLTTSLWAGTGFAQVFDEQTFKQNYITAGQSNCRLWKVSPNDFRMGLVSGYMDLWRYMRSGDNINTALAKANHGEMIEGITGICAKPENAQLQVTDALILFAGKVGGLPPDQIEDLAARMRADYAKDSPKRDQ